MHKENPGIEFEKVVAAIQAQLDPAATVSHNEVLKDRLQQPRQFDVVIRGQFAGQDMLGVFECKDLKRKVGTPEVDAFVTKAQDINANFKVLMSRRGFTGTALKKCQHYGIQPLSLISDDPANRTFLIGAWWYANLTKWNQFSVTLHFVSPPSESVQLQVPGLTISGKKILDWFTNYLLDHENDTQELGWVINISVLFDEPQLVTIQDGTSYLCSAISFSAERVCERLERFVGISGAGFYNWQKKQAMFPPNSQIVTDAVPMDFTQWKPRTERQAATPGFIELTLSGNLSTFERVPDVLPLDTL